MPDFEIFYAELEDLAPGDPMRPAALVHMQGPDAKVCYDAIGRAYSIYVIGRGRLPLEVGEGYFVVASRPDYPVLREALRPFWPEVPGEFPAHRPGEVPVTRSQELSDVINYVARPPEPDPHIFDEARRRLRGLVPRRHLTATAHVCRWLRENMNPANNCYTISALLARWLREHGAPARYCTGWATFRMPRRPPVTIAHAWVDLGGRICDLTLDRQSAWSLRGRRIRHFRVDSPRIEYRRGDERPGLEAHWRLYSKPSGRPAYTEASLERQSRMIREAAGPLYHERRVWIDLIREHGILEGTYRLLLEMFG